MGERYRSEAGHVRHACLRDGMLPHAVLAAKLPDDFGDLADSGRTERMALAEQAARGIDRATSADRRRPTGEEFAGLARAAEAESLGVDQRLDREGVMQFDNVEVLVPDAGGATCASRGVAAHRHDRRLPAVIERLAVHHRGGDADRAARLDAEPADRVLAGDDRGGPAFA